MLSVTDLKVGLDSDAGLVKAIDGLSLAIANGETFCLVGESGCGKSMTALALLRLLPENGRINSGVVSIQHDNATIDLVSLSEAQMRDQRGGDIGIIFQEPGTSLNPVMRVGDQIVETIEAHTPLRGAAALAKAIDWLKRVGIPEPERRINDYPFQMSGGQKQRVMIAIALAAEPRLLIADEPTTALDVTIQAQILQLLKDLQRDLGMALLMITHDLAVVSKMADRVALMYAGQIVEVAEAADFFNKPLHPYARQLLQALPDSAKRGQPLAAIKGTVPALTREFTGCRFADRCGYAIDSCHTTLPQLLEVAGTHAVRCLLLSKTVTELPDLPVQAEAVAPLSLKSPKPVSVNASPTGSVLLSVSDLRVAFPIRKGLLKREVGAFNAVDGISFDVQRGKTLALVGESGCGKSTTGKAMLRLLDSVARVTGNVTLDGQPLMELKGEALRAARRKIQIIFQDPFASLNPRMRVGEILHEGMISLRPDITLAERVVRTRALLDRVGLRPEAYDRYPHEFSGGQRQRVAIARALAVEPELIICDEPTSALDVSVQAQILNLLNELQRELNVAYLFITHNFGVVEYFADTIAVMNRGQIVEAGDAESVLAAPQDPYTKRLLDAVPRLSTSN